MRCPSQGGKRAEEGGGEVIHTEETRRPREMVCCARVIAASNAGSFLFKVFQICCPQDTRYQMRCGRRTRT